MTKSPKKIFIVKLCCLGDVIYTIPLLKTIKNNLPGTKISYLTTSWCKGLLEIIPEVDDYIIFNTPFEKKGVLKKVLGFLKLVLQVRKSNFDTAINLHRNNLFTILFFLSGIKTRIGFGNSKFLTNKIIYSDLSHESEKFLSTIKDYNFKDYCKIPEIQPSDSDIEFIKNLLEKYKIREDDYIVGMYVDGGNNPGSIMNIRQLSYKKYTGFIKHLLFNYNIKILLIDSKDTESNATKIFHEVNDKERCILLSNLDIRQISALEKTCKMIVGNDTGMLHLAAAVNTPVIMFYGPDDPNQWAPIGNQHQIVWHKIECAPCYTSVSVRDKRNFFNNNFICKRGDVLCMESITVEEMIGAFEKVYNRKLHN